MCILYASHCLTDGVNSSFLPSPRTGMRLHWACTDWQSCQILPNRYFSNSNAHTSHVLRGLLNTDSDPASLGCGHCVSRPAGRWGWRSRSVDPWAAAQVEGSGPQSVVTGPAAPDSWGNCQKRTSPGPGFLNEKLRPGPLIGAWTSPLGDSMHTKFEDHWCKWASLLP